MAEGDAHVLGPKLLNWDQIEANHRASLSVWRDNEDKRLAQSYEAQFSEVDEEITQIVHRIADIRDEKRKMEQEFEEERTKLAQARAGDDECKREWFTTVRNAGLESDGSTPHG